MLNPSSANDLNFAWRHRSLDAYLDGDERKSSTSNMTQTRGKTINIQSNRAPGLPGKIPFFGWSCHQSVSQICFESHLHLTYVAIPAQLDTQSCGLSKPLVQTRSWVLLQTPEHEINSNKRGRSFDFRWISTVIRRASLAEVQLDAKGTRDLWLGYTWLLRIGLTDEDR